jgi:hypothetical protein
MEARVRALEEDNRALHDDNEALRRRLAEVEANVRTLLMRTAQTGLRDTTTECMVAPLVPVPLEEGDVVESEAEEEVDHVVQAELSGAGSGPSNRKDVRVAGDRFCGAAPGKRLQYRFDSVDGGQEWFGGRVTKLLKSWPGWASVRFDDGETLEVQLEPGSELATWRWEPTSPLRKIRGDRAPVVPLGCDDQSGTLSMTTPIVRSHRKRSTKRQRTCLHSHKLLLSSAVSAGDTATVATRSAPSGANVRKRVQHNARSASDGRPTGPCRKYSRFIGVSWDWFHSGMNGRWVVRVRVAGKQVVVGRFPEDKEEEAAHAFDKAARFYRGTKAHGSSQWRLNFPTKEEIAVAEANNAAEGN